MILFGLLQLLLFQFCYCCYYCSCYAVHVLLLFLLLFFYYYYCNVDDTYASVAAVPFFVATIISVVAFAVAEAIAISVAVLLLPGGGL